MYNEYNIYIHFLIYYTLYTIHYSILMYIYVEHNFGPMRFHSGRVTRDTKSYLHCTHKARIICRRITSRLVRTQHFGFFRQLILHSQVRLKTR